MQREDVNACNYDSDIELDPDDNEDEDFVSESEENDGLLEHRSDDDLVEMGQDSVETQNDLADNTSPPELSQVMGNSERAVEPRQENTSFAEAQTYGNKFPQSRRGSVF